jgi:hypothetical protein
MMSQTQKRSPRLSKDQVNEIMIMIEENWDYDWIAGKFGVTRRTIADITAGRTYRKLTQNRWH